MAQATAAANMFSYLHRNERASWYRILGHRTAATGCQLVACQLTAPPFPSPAGPSPENECQVCHQAVFKYKCPGCAARTCSLACCNEHKTSTGCSGRRDRLAFVAMKDFSDSNLLSDYRLLEEIQTADDNARRHRWVADYVLPTAAICCIVAVTSALARWKPAGSLLCYAIFQCTSARHACWDICMFGKHLHI